MTLSVFFECQNVENPLGEQTKCLGARLRPHSQNMTVVARQMAEKKTVGHLS